MTGKNFRVTAEVVNGKCPTCDEYTMLVGLSKSFFRCMNCGAEIEKISKADVVEKKPSESTIEVKAEEIK